MDEAVAVAVVECSKPPCLSDRIPMMAHPVAEAVEEPEEAITHWTTAIRTKASSRITRTSAQRTTPKSHRLRAPMRVVDVVAAVAVISVDLIEEMDLEAAEDIEEEVRRLL